MNECTADRERAFRCAGGALAFLCGYLGAPSPHLDAPSPHLDAPSPRLGALKGAAAQGEVRLALARRRIKRMRTAVGD